jgi:hypothetical protein
MKLWSARAERPQLRWWERKPRGVEIPDAGNEPFDMEVKQYANITPSSSIYIDSTTILRSRSIQIVYWLIGWFWSKLQVTETRISIWKNQIWTQITLTKMLVQYFLHRRYNVYTAMIRSPGPHLWKRDTQRGGEVVLMLERCIVISASLFKCSLINSWNCSPRSLRILNLFHIRLTVWWWHVVPPELNSGISSTSKVMFICNFITRSAEPRLQKGYEMTWRPPT